MNERMLKLNLFVLFVLMISFCYAQNREQDKMVINGVVYGYKFDPAIKLIKKNESSLEGTIAGVQLTVYKDSKRITSAKSSSNGAFSLTVPLEDGLRVEYALANYTSASFNLDLGNVPATLKKTGLIFNDVELGLNSFVSEKTNDKRPFGTISYSTGSEELIFTEITYSDRKRLFGDNPDITPVTLITKSIANNVSNNKVGSSVSNEPGETNQPDQIVPPTIDQESNADQNKRHFLGNSPIILELATDEDLKKRQSEIDLAWEQLKQDRLSASSPEQLAIIEAKELLLVAAQKELDDAKKFIAIQNEKIAAQQTKIWLLFLILIIVAIAGFVIWRYARQKSILNKELDQRNRKILEGIHYAQRIQQSILLPEQQIAAILPDSFVLYKPLDIVSGDLYWISKVHNKVIVAAVDCTGHGVPGAFMSLIANTLLNHIVNEKRITAVTEILDQLHKGIVASLRQTESEENNQDGMDLAIISVDLETKTLEFSGAMNPAYLVYENELHILEANLKPIGGREMNRKKSQKGFVGKTVAFKSGTCLYLTTDGFMDQFGGPENTKFNIPKFKKLLLDHHGVPMRSQKIQFEKALQEWQGTAKQTDDILVIGIRF